MKSLNFKTYLISNLDIDEDETLKLLENCNSRTFKKDQFLLQENEYSKHTFFVEKGLLRQFSIDEKGKVLFGYYPGKSKSGSQGPGDEKLQKLISYHTSMHRSWLMANFTV